MTRSNTGAVAFAISLINTLLLISPAGLSQTVPQQLGNAWDRFTGDAQLAHAISSITVMEAKTGTVIFERNAQAGLAPASTQKIVTSVTAFELLGPAFRFNTRLGYIGNIAGDTLKGDLVVLGSGDPTLGSPRWAGTSAVNVLNEFNSGIIANKIRFVDGSLYANHRDWDTQTLPGGWIWDDIGNYYGAGAALINWKENQYDLHLKAGEETGAATTITDPDELPSGVVLTNEVRTGEKGSGDNSYIYLPPYSQKGYIRGTIPFGERAFRISGSIPDPVKQFSYELGRHLMKRGLVSMQGKTLEFTAGSPANNRRVKDEAAFRLIISHQSPALDSIIYWFNKKSINLYGEALLKAIAAKDLQAPALISTDLGVKKTRAFWKSKGLDETELNISDGSGLSPQNRITTHAQVFILMYAKARPWFPLFFRALPEYNGMHMKSGTISNVKGFCGYHVSAAGKEYVFSFLVNNYNGASSTLVEKMYRVLNELK